MADICVLLMRAGLILMLAGTAGAQSRNSKAQENAPPSNTLAGEMLALHNAIRIETKLPPLQWSGTLAGYAQKWANMLQATNRTTHSPNSPYGENIFVTGAGSVPSLAIEEWASESRDYSYPTNSCKGVCGHYTQLIWRNTRTIGCGLARGPQRDIWVCSYDPPGNYKDEWPY
jgi:pathogenesis-related protein 1